jgi:hypothetical protein
MKRLFLLGFILAVLWQAPAQAAIIGPAGAELSVAPGKTEIFSILLDTEGESVNALQLTVTYPKELIDIVSVDQARSPFTLTVESPTIDAQRGTVSLVAGLPGGTVISNAPVMTLVVRGKTRGEDTVGIDLALSSLALADGNGTRVPLVGKATKIVVKDGDPLVPVLRSSSHPDQTRWYSERTFTVSWEQRKAFYSVLLSPNSEAVPDDIPETVEGGSSYPNLADGIWYFSMKERLEGENGWSPVARYRILVDATAPEPFTVSRVRPTDETPWLASFSAVDTLSGIATYKVREEGPRFSWFPFYKTKHVTETTQLPYQLQDQNLYSRVVVVAVDQAGNQTVGELAARSTMFIRDAWYALIFLTGILLFTMVRKKKAQS